MSKQSFSTIIRGYRSHVRESKISWRYLHPDTPIIHWHASHATNLSKPPTLKKLSTPMIVCIYTTLHMYKCMLLYIYTYIVLHTDNHTNHIHQD